MAHAVWTPLAEDDLEEILFQIRVVDKRPLTARRNGAAIHDAVNAPANMEIHDVAGFVDGQDDLQERINAVIECVVVGCAAHIGILTNEVSADAASQIADALRTPQPQWNRQLAQSC